jgi:glycosyltransferase involved in cell wall biosynthesis
MSLLNNQTNKLKIAQVIDVYDGSTNGGCISTQRFTKLLREDNNQVFILSTGKSDTDKIQLEEFYLPINYLKKVMQRMKFVFAKPDKQILEKVFSQVDVIHNQFPFLLGIAAVNLAKKMNKPIVSTYHIQAEQLMYNSGLMHPFFTKLTYKWFMHFIYNKSDVVICPSAFAQQEILRYGCKSKTVVISNGITEDYHPMDVAKKYSDKFTLLTVGRNAVEKRQNLIIQAIAQSKYKHQIQLVVLGDGPLRNSLEKLSDELLPNKTLFQLLPTNEVIEYYNTADLYVHAANIEVECMTALEAMACGLPLLIADEERSATKQFALSKKFLFKTIDALTERINYWFENRAELQQAKEDYLSFSRQFTIEDSYQKLVHSYHLALEMHQHKIEVPIYSQLQEA